MSGMDAVVASRPVVRYKGNTEERFGGALLSCTVSMPAEGMDCCELRLTDWGQLDGRLGHLFDDLAFGDELEIEFEGTSTQKIFSGVITGLEAQFGGGGAPQLVVLAEDALCRLARHRRSQVYEKKQLKQVVAMLAQEARLLPDCDDTTQGTWHQLHETDLGFLRRIAASFGYSIRLVDGNKLSVRAPQAQGEPITIDLAAAPPVGLRLLADLNRQATEVTAAGYDVASGRSVTAKANKLSSAPGGSSAAELLNGLTWNEPSHAPWLVPTNQEQATRFARAAFERMAGQFVRGELLSEGDPRFVPGASVKLTNVSRRFEGTYAVISCTHRFDLDQGYRCLLRLARGGIS